MRFASLASIGVASAIKMKSSPNPTANAHNILSALKLEAGLDGTCYPGPARLFDTLEEALAEKPSGGMF